MEFKQQALELLNGGILAQRAFFKEPQEVFLLKMVSHIGTENSEIRDDLNYRLLIDLLQYKVLSEEQQQYILQAILADNLLHFKLGESNTPSVFTRALAAEWIRLLLTQEQISGEVGEAVLHNALLLLDRELDLRAYTESGFAYSVGNSALLVNIILRERDDILRYAPSTLTAIQSNFWKEHVFTDDEEERFISIIELLLARNIDEAILIEWIEQVFDRLETISQFEGYSPKFLKARTEILNFMKSLYFVLKFKNNYNKIQSILSIFIQKWNRI